MQPLLIPGLDIPDWAADVIEGESIQIDGLPNELYHGTKALVSKSALDIFARSPAHYHFSLFNHLEDENKEPAEALVIGSAFHCLVLEPDLFRSTYVQLPDFGDMRSSRNRDMKRAWKSEHPDAIEFLEKSQMHQIEGMRDGLMRHKRIRRILENFRPEVTCATICPETGLPRKVRFDGLAEIEGLGFDLKSARDGSPDMWVREAAKRRYNVQDRYYTETGNLCDADIQEMAFIVVEKTAPFVSGLYVLDPTAKLSGEQKFKNDLDGIARRVQSGTFEGYGDDAKEIRFPGWAVADVATTP